MKNRDIGVTDIQFHTNKIRNPKSFGRQIERSIRKNEPGRVYFEIGKDKKMEMTFGKDILDLAEKLAKKGENLRIIVPKPIMGMLGNDTKEFLKAHPELVVKALDKK